MKKHIITSILLGSMVLGGSQFIYAETIPVEKTMVVTAKQDNISNLTYSEFIRNIVVEVVGEQPQIMDAHYALPYMQKAEEMKWIEKMPVEKWNEKISQAEMDSIIAKLNANQQKLVKEKLNQLIVNTISINGQNLELGQLEPVVRNGNVMVPLRKTAEALGFKVTWQAEGGKIELDNGSVKTELEVGFDNYYKASSQAIGLTKPVQYGTAPMIIDGTVYVPAQLFSLLFSNPNAVAINQGNLSITTK